MILARHWWDHITPLINTLKFYSPFTHIKAKFLRWLYLLPPPPPSFWVSSTSILHLPLSLHPASQHSTPLTPHCLYLNSQPPLPSTPLSTYHHLTYCLRPGHFCLAQSSSDTQSHPRIPQWVGRDTVRFASCSEGFLSPILHPFPFIF